MFSPHEMDCCCQANGIIVLVSCIFTTAISKWSVYRNTLAAYAHIELRQKSQHISWKKFSPMRGNKTSVQFYLPLYFKRCRFQIWARSAGENNRARIAVSAGVKKMSNFWFRKAWRNEHRHDVMLKISNSYREWLQGQFAIIGWEREIGGVARHAHSSRAGMEWKRHSLRDLFIHLFIIPTCSKLKRHSLSLRDQCAQLPPQSVTATRVQDGKSFLEKRWIANVTLTPIAVPRDTLKLTRWRKVILT